MKLLAHLFLFSLPVPAVWLPTALEWGLCPLSKSVPTEAPQDNLLSVYRLAGLPLTYNLLVFLYLGHSRYQKHSFLPDSILIDTRKPQCPSPYQNLSQKKMSSFTMSGQQAGQELQLCPEQ